MPIAEVVQYLGAIAILGIAEFDYFSQLTPLESCATLDVVWIDAKLGAWGGVEHDDAATASRDVPRGFLLSGPRGRRCGRTR